MRAHLKDRNFQNKIDNFFFLNYRKFQKQVCNFNREELYDK